jgi:hypothetical protein
LLELELDPRSLELPLEPPRRSDCELDEPLRDEPWSRDDDEPLRDEL